MENVYRPRRRTREEEDDEQEQAVKRHKARHFQKQRDGSVQSSSKLRISEGGIAYRDYEYRRVKPGLTRWALDASSYAERTQPVRPFWTPGTALPTLGEICTRSVAEHFGDPGVLNELDARHRLVMPELLRHIALSLPEKALPLSVWALAAEVAEVPLMWRTYRGLCLNDTLELADLKDRNEMAAAEWSALQQDPSRHPVIPTFFLAILDLSNDVSFCDTDIGKLSSVSAFLAVLRIDYTKVSDSGVASLARNVDHGEAYQRLEILSLAGLKKVTDVSAPKVAQLPNLRMLDIRETSCTDEFQRILGRKAANPQRWAQARHRQDLEGFPSRELENFGSSLSLSHVLTSTRLIASRNRVIDPFLLAKPVTVHITSISRSAPPPDLADRDVVDALYTSVLEGHRPAPRTNVVYNRTFGNISRLVPLSSEVLQDDAANETSKGAAFRMRDDGVSAGALVGGRKTGGYASLFDAGTRKTTPATSKLAPLSDWGSDDEDGDSLDERLLSRSFRHFRKQPKDGQDMIECPRPGPFMLVRHLPVLSPFVTRETKAALVADVQPSDHSVRLEAGATVLKKKKRSGGEDSLSSLFRRAPTAPSSGSSIRPTPFSFSSASSSPSLSRKSSTPASSSAPSQRPPPRLPQPGLSRMGTPSVAAKQTSAKSESWLAQYERRDSAQAASSAALSFSQSSAARPVPARASSSSRALAAPLARRKGLAAFRR